jgi:hypothetical protein
MDKKDIQILTAIAREGTASPEEIEDATEIPIRSSLAENPVAIC